MNDRLWFQFNAVLGSLAVTVGLWFLVGGLPLSLGVTLAVGLAILLALKCPSIGYIWAASTLFLGMESFAWPIMQMVDLQKLGPEPPLEEMQRIFTAVLFGLFSGVFWITFAYGIFKRSRGTDSTTTPSVTTPQTKNQRKRSRKKSR